MKNFRTIAAITLASGLAAAPALAADEKAQLEVGVLTCDLTGGSNAIVLSKYEYFCQLDSQDDSKDGDYIATIDKVGLDLSTTSTETLKWAVATSNENFTTKMMDGTYVGAGADIAVGIGGGVKVLVGGESDMISLQPLSVSGKTGLGATLALEEMELRRVAE